MTSSDYSMPFALAKHGYSFHSGSSAGIPLIRVGFQFNRRHANDSTECIHLLSSLVSTAPLHLHRQIQIQRIFDKGHWFAWSCLWYNGKSATQLNFCRSCISIESRFPSRLSKPFVLVFFFSYLVYAIGCVCVPVSCHEYLTGMWEGYEKKKITKELCKLLATRCTSTHTTG